MDAIARQPEASGKIQTAMLIAAALLKVLDLLHYLQLKTTTKAITVGYSYCLQLIKK